MLLSLLMWTKFGSHGFIYLSVSFNIILILDFFHLITLIFVWVFLLFSVMLRVFYFFFITGFLIYLLLLLSLDGKSVTYLIDLCQNGCSDIKNRKCWCVHLKIYFSASTYYVIKWKGWFSPFYFYNWCLIELPHRKHASEILFVVLLDLHSQLHIPEPVTTPHPCHHHSD